MKVNITDKHILLFAGILVALVLLFLYKGHLLFPDLSMSLSMSTPGILTQPFNAVADAIAGWLQVR